MKSIEERLEDLREDIVTMHRRIDNAVEFLGHITAKQLYNNLVTIETDLEITKKAVVLLKEDIDGGKFEQPTGEVL